MSSLLVLGGTSWLGGWVASIAADAGHDVTCLARGETGAAPPGATFVRADRSVAGAYDEVAGQAWDAVVDVSSQPGQVRSAVAALGASTSRWVLVSTGSVYADQTGALTEDSPVLPPLDGDVAAGPEQYGEGKAACEDAVRGLPQHLIVRAGLIGGPGDRSDRLGHYVARFALAADGPVLVPDVGEQPMQVVDVRDLAAWIVAEIDGDQTGTVHGVGEPSTVGELVRLSAEAAGFTGNIVTASSDELHAHDVGEWMGPRSLPLWLPATHPGLGLMDDSRALAWGLRRRPLAETLADVLADEQARGLDRARRAGLTRQDELNVINAMRR